MELPADFLERLAADAAKGADRLARERSVAKNVIQFRADNPVPKTTIQARPMCPKCWTHIMDEAWSKFRHARRTLKFNFECGACKAVFEYTPTWAR
jgi:hypothetical protein